MKNQTIIFVAICAICFLFYRCNNPAGHSTATNDSASLSNMYDGYASQTEWGKHLIAVGGCGDCHTAKKMGPQGPVDDSSMLFSGHLATLPAPSIDPAEVSKGIAATNDLTVWVGPWGTSYSANITPDSTGIVSWTEDQFITCIRQGLFKGIAGSRPLMPPMPIESYRNLRDDELKAMFAYLKTVNPIHNAVPEYQPPAATK